MYKSRLCNLFERGGCNRQNCSFAHGDEELRRYSGSNNVRRNYQSGDLRDKLDRRISPKRRYSPRRDVRERRTNHGYSRSSSLEKKSDMRSNKKERLDGRNDLSGSLRISAGGERSGEEEKTSRESSIIFKEQLKKTEEDIRVLNHHKVQLEFLMSENVQQVDSLTSRVSELETQLSKEKEDLKRRTSQIKKFVKLHNRHSQFQNELKRSQLRLQKFVDQLGSDITGDGGIQEDLNINIFSDEEHMDVYLNSPRKAAEHYFPLKKKRLHVDNESHEAAKESRQEDSKYVAGTTRPAKRLHTSARVARLDDNNELVINNDNESRGDGHMAKEGKQRGNVAVVTSLREKGKGLGTGVLPSTSMAAHVVDEVAEFEQDERSNAIEVKESRRNGGATEMDNEGYPLVLPPPPPLLPGNHYLKYQAEDGTINMVEEEMIEIV